MKTKTNSKFKAGKDVENALPNNNPMSGIFDLPGVGSAGAYGQIGGLGSWGPEGRVAPLSEPWELIYNNSYMMISLMQVVLSYAYVIHGPLRTVVDLPVYDSFRGGIKIKTDEVSPEELEDLHRLMKKTKLVRKLIDARRWARLYGGSGVILNTTDSKSNAWDKPFILDDIDENSKISFIVADRWQLSWMGTPMAPKSKYIYNPGSDAAENNILTATLDQSRVARLLSEEAPSLVRGRTLGWSLSVLECILREINMYFKENNAIYQYIDEFKIDVYKFKGLNAGFLSGKATAATTLRIKIANWIKSFMGAVIMDAEDDFVQKQLSVSGLADLMKQIQISMAAAARMPVSKLFGLSATGFSDGESDLEVYNSIVGHERGFCDDALDILIPPLMMKCWGFVPDDWYTEWPALREMSAEQEQNVKNSKHTRNMDLYDRGLYTPQEAMEAEKADGIVQLETAVAKGAEPEPPISQMATDGMALEEAKPTPKPSAGKKGKE